MSGVWRCKNCGKEIYNHVPENCPHCGIRLTGDYEPSFDSVASDRSDTGEACVQLFVYVFMIMVGFVGASMVHMNPLWGAIILPLFVRLVWRTLVKSQKNENITDAGFMILIFLIAIITLIFAIY